MFDRARVRGRFRRERSRLTSATYLVLAFALGACGGGEGAESAGESRSVATRPTLSQELDFELPTLDGGRLKLADALVDGPVILDFWATWCAPCKLAMPAYSELAARYAEHGVKLWAVSWDDPRMHDRIAPYFERAGFTFPALLDADKRVGRGLGVVNLPTTFLVAADGSLAWQHVGYASGDEKALETALRATLGLD